MTGISFCLYLPYRTGKVPEEQIIEIWETGSMRLAFNLKAVSQIQEMVYSGSGSNLSEGPGSGSDP